MTLPAINHRLDFVTVDGKIDHAAIALVAPARAEAIKARYGHKVTLDAAGWLQMATEDCIVQADGELQLYEMRCITRGMGLQTNDDIVFGRA